MLAKANTQSRNDFGGSPRLAGFGPFRTFSCSEEIVTSGLRRDTASVVCWTQPKSGQSDHTTCSGRNRLVSILTPGPMVEDTVILRI